MATATRASNEEPSTKPEAPTAPSPWPPAPPDASSDFCVEAVHALDEESCYVLPDAPTPELLVYLHGIVPPEATSPQKTKFETVVANASRRANVAALMPRGRRGLGPRGREDWWGWPTTKPSYEKLAREVVIGIATKRQKLEALTGRPFGRVYVAGSSSGAYFVAALALNGGIEADGFGAISGGSLGAYAPKEGIHVAPFYVGYGTADTVRGAARLLAAHLRKAGWPVEIAEHPLPHGAAEIYLDEAIAFWREHRP